MWPDHKRSLAAKVNVQEVYRNIVFLRGDYFVWSSKGNPYEDRNLPYGGYVRSTWGLLREQRRLLEGQNGTEKGVGLVRTTC